MRKFHLENPNVTHDALVDIFEQELGKRVGRTAISPILRNDSWTDPEYKPINFTNKIIQELYKKFKDTPRVKRKDMIKYIEDNFGLHTTRYDVEKIFTGRGLAKKVREDFDIDEWV